MRKRLLLFIACLIIPTHTAWSHPHAFVECTFSFVMDAQGLKGFRQHWVLDEMTSVAVLDVVDTNRDAALSAAEKQALHDLTVESLKAFHYFTAVRINGREFPVQKITDFSGQLKDGKLIYNFLVPCPVKAAPGKAQQVKVAVYDDSFYTYVSYVQEGGVGIDPSKDPLFANRDAPAKPEDFKRFAKAVGIAKYEGDIPITGDIGKFKLKSGMQDAPEMAYFYDQIIPQPFFLQFKLP